MKTKFYLPTYQEAQDICKNNDTFYEKKYQVNGLEVSIFNYRLSQHKDFEEPITGSPVKAHEMRGLTFVHTENGPVRYLALHKFFNLNQVEGYQYHEVKDFAVTRVQDKADGSMIRFVPVNGKVFAKTKNSFDNGQAFMALDVHNKDSKIQGFVKESLELGLAAQFELISPLNQIVLTYNQTKLVLLQIRDEKTGEYSDIYSHPLVVKYGIECAQSEDLAHLDSFISRAKTEENREGWILTLSNGQMMKIKTEWYCALHGLLTNDLARENKIIGLILDEKLDDAFGLIGEKDIRKVYSEQIQSGVVKYLDQKMKETLELKSKYNGVRKDFALTYKSHPLFSIAVKVLDEKEADDKIYEMLKYQLTRQTSGLMDAKAFVGEVLGITLQNLDETFESDG